ncbi:MAG TPA: hypothetical protein VEH06_13130 [Candidatus Bathyarchaeia archaeon]|nr:hypothetical protein [Candidatus Bathyarchaeia archaeon]
MPKSPEQLPESKISLYKPIRPMLAERVRTVQEALERIGPVAAAEYKLDGERVQIHKGEGKCKVELFSRRLENITHNYPDIIKEVSNSIKVKEVIIEGEVVRIDPQTSEFLPFQELMHRRRKHKVEETMESYPVVVNIFDVLFVDKTSLPYSNK